MLEQETHAKTFKNEMLLLLSRGSDLFHWALKLLYLPRANTSLLQHGKRRSWWVSKGKAMKKRKGESLRVPCKTNVVKICRILLIWARNFYLRRAGDSGLNMVHGYLVIYYPTVISCFLKLVNHPFNKPLWNLLGINVALFNLHSQNLFFLL
jgi:hypothetical protein